MEVFFTLLQENFGWTQIGLATVFVLILWWINLQKESKSRFKVREADRARFSGLQSSDAKEGLLDSLAEAKFNLRSPHLLGGIRLDLPPHEILGIPQNADRETVVSAHKSLMRRYHPDLVGPPGTQPWKDAQEIAQKINEAKEILLKRLKK